MISRIRTINFKFISKTLAETSVAEKISDERILTTEFEFAPDSGNSGNMFIGNADVTSGSIPRAAGTSGRASYNAEDIPGEPRHFDLSTLYVTGTAGDSVVVQYRVEE